MVTFNRILCPVDFSEASRHALDQAVVVGRFFESRLTVLHVFNQVFLPVPGMAMPGYGPDMSMSAEDVRRMQQDAERLAEPVRAAGLTADVVVEPGAPAPHILAKAKTIAADLIVMGTHGASGFERLMLGSVTEKVLRKAPCPVLTVPPRSAGTAAVPFKHLLCAVDFSECSLNALAAALALAKEADAELTILHVLDWPVDASPVGVAAPGEAAMGPAAFDLEGYRRMLERDARERLARLVPADAREWCTPQTLVAHGKPHVEVLRAAEDRHADLIVLGVRGRNPLDLMLFGSTTNQIVRRAACAVLTTR